VNIDVLIVDDDTLLRAGLELMINTQPDLTVVGQAGDGETAIAMASQLKPDVVLMDIRMPGIDGLEATRRIAAASAQGTDTKPIRVLILTTFEIDQYVYEAVRAGASGFLLKRTPPEDLLEGIRIVAGGDALLAPSITRRLMDEFAAGTAAGPRATDVRNRELDRLTDREREVLTLVGSGLSNREIADELYIAPSTVKTHIKHILTKLDLRDRIHAVVFAYETGLLEPRGGG